MPQPISALLVHQAEDPMSELKSVLEGQQIVMIRAHSCREATDLLSSHSLNLVFTDAEMPDGAWCDVVEAAAAARTPVRVIVVARVSDVRFYLEVMQRGAFDFLTPPFAPADVGHVIRCAVGR